MGIGAEGLAREVLREEEFEKLKEVSCGWNVKSEMEE